MWIGFGMNLINNYRLMKNILLSSLIVAIILTFFSLTIVRIDLSYHDFENKVLYNLEDEFFFIKNKSNKQGTCDVICRTQRWYPLPMTNYPYLHDDTRFTEVNIILNLLFYFSISLFSLIFYKINLFSFLAFRK